MKGGKMSCYVLDARDPGQRYLARLEYRDPDPFTTWLGGEPFLEAPALPIEARVISDRQTCWSPLWGTPLPVMSKRLLAAILNAGVASAQVEAYPVTLVDAYEGRTDTDQYVAFNLCCEVSLLELPSDQVAFIARAREQSGLIVISEPVKASLSPLLVLYDALNLTPIDTEAMKAVLC